MAMFACLAAFYVADILWQVIENGGEVGRKSAKKAQEPFHVTPDDLARIKVAEEALLISRFCDIINGAVKQW